MCFETLYTYFSKFSLKKSFSLIDLDLTSTKKKLKNKNIKVVYKLNFASTNIDQNLVEKKS